uniref:SHSP domain-containing protein n=1 Tax=Arcella intermedia TaxID=1963864 RepID=A0A6B2LT89_9EUKA
MPGMRKEDVQVQFKRGALEISGKKEEHKKDEGATWHREERRYGEFRRVIPFPKNIDENKISAKLTEGLLEIHVPKVQSEEPKQHSVKIE